MQIGDPWDGFFHPTLTLVMDSYIQTGTDRMLVREANGEEPDQTASFCACWGGGGGGGQLMFEILEHLL